MKAVRDVIASNRVPYLLMTSVGSHNKSGRDKDKEGRKNERKWGGPCTELNISQYYIVRSI